MGSSTLERIVERVILMPISIIRCFLNVEGLELWLAEITILVDCHREPSTHVISVGSSTRKGTTTSSGRSTWHGQDTGGDAVLHFGIPKIIPPEFIFVRISVTGGITLCHNGLHEVFPTSGWLGDVAQVARLDDEAGVLVIVRARSLFSTIPFTKEGVAIDRAVRSAYKA